MLIHRAVRKNGNTGSSGELKNAVDIMWSIGARLIKQLYRTLFQLCTIKPRRLCLGYLNWPAVTSEQIIFHLHLFLYKTQRSCTALGSRSPGFKFVNGSVFWVHSDLQGIIGGLRDKAEWGRVRVNAAQMRWCCIGSSRGSCRSGGVHSAGVWT